MRALVPCTGRKQQISGSLRRGIIISEKREKSMNNVKRGENRGGGKSRTLKEKYVQPDWVPCVRSEKTGKNCLSVLLFHYTI
jgi:hypothetical protein